MIDNDGSDCRKQPVHSRQGHERSRGIESWGLAGLGEKCIPSRVMRAALPFSWEKSVASSLIPHFKIEMWGT